MKTFKWTQDVVEGQGGIDDQSVAKELLQLTLMLSSRSDGELDVLIALSNDAFLELADEDEV